MVVDRWCRIPALNAQAVSTRQGLTRLAGLGCRYARIHARLRLTHPDSGYFRIFVVAVHTCARRSWAGRNSPTRILHHWTSHPLRPAGLGRGRSGQHRSPWFERCAEQHVWIPTGVSAGGRWDPATGATGGWVGAPLAAPASPGRGDIARHTAFRVLSAETALRSAGVARVVATTTRTASGAAHSPGHHGAGGACDADGVAARAGDAVALARTARPRTPVVGISACWCPGEPHLRRFGHLRGLSPRRARHRPGSHRRLQAQRGAH